MPNGAKNYCFTLNNPTQDERNRYDRLLEDYENLVQYYIYQEERVTTTHFQGYIQFKKRMTYNQVKEVLGTRPHLEVARGTAQQCRDYCTKEESRISGPYEYGVMMNRGKRNDLERFVKAAEDGLTEELLINNHAEVLAKYPRFVDRVLKHNKEKSVVIEPMVPRNWQLRLCEILEHDPDPRQVIWYVDPVGNTGKSYFARHYKNRETFVITGGRHSDIYYAYNYEPVVIFDFARTKEEAIPWEVIENFKNGYFLSTKYEVKRMRFSVPHVVCFSNFDPDRSKLSADRWNVTQIRTLE